MKKVQDVSTFNQQVAGMWYYLSALGSSSQVNEKVNGLIFMLDFLINVFYVYTPKPVGY